MDWCWYSYIILNIILPSNLSTKLVERRYQINMFLFFWRNLFIASTQFIHLSKRWSFMKPGKNHSIIRSIPLSEIQVYAYYISINCLKIDINDFHFNEISFEFASLFWHFISIYLFTFKALINVYWLGKE